MAECHFAILTLKWASLATSTVMSNELHKKSKLWYLSMILVIIFFK